MNGFIDLTNTWQERIDIFREHYNNDPPQFFIIVGDKGAGKRTYVKEYIGKRYMRYPVMEYDSGIESVRQLIDDSRTIFSPTIHLIADIQDLSIMAQNALLKVLEEPPKNHWFIATADNYNNVARTIQSRAIVYFMNYSKEGIAAMTQKIFNKGDLNVYSELCTTPGQLLEIKEHDWNVHEWIEFGKKVVDNIADVSICNAFKISDNVAIKDDSDKIPMDWFFRIILFVAQSSNAHVICNRTYQAQRLLLKKSLNKQMIFDQWLLGIREDMRIAK